MIMADQDLLSSDRLLLVEGQDDKHVVLHPAISAKGSDIR